MSESRLPAASPWPWLLAMLLAAATVPAAASAQAEPQRSWAVVPMLGFGVIEQGDWGSAGMEAALEIEHRRTGWRWGGWISQRGLGVGCSEACFDGGPAIAAGATRSVGPLWIGAGAGVMRQFHRWRFLPYGRISVDAAPVRFEVRVELPQQDGLGAYVPILIGFPL